MTDSTERRMRDHVLGALLLILELATGAAVAVVLAEWVGVLP